MSDLLIRGAKILTGDEKGTIIENGAVLVSGSRIKETGDYQTMKQKYAQAEEIGAEKMWVLPGFVNAHHHSQGLFQIRNGLYDEPLELWLLRSFSSKMGSKTPELAYWDSLYTCTTLLKSGITTTIDVFYGGDATPYLGTEDGLKAYIDSGLRVAFAPVARDEYTSYVHAQDEEFLMSLPDKLRKTVINSSYGKQPLDGDFYLENWQNIYREYHGYDGRVTVLLAPDGPQWVTKELLLKIKDLAQKYQTNIQTHCLETKYQAFYAKNRLGKTMIEYLDGLGFLGPEVSLAHGVWLTEKDVAICAKSKTSISHNPGSNLRLYSGILPLRDYLAAGINVGIGTDNLSFTGDNDYLADLRLASLLHRAPGIPPVEVGAERLLEIGTMGGARLLGLDQKIGSVVPDKDADLVLIDPDNILSPCMHPSVSVYDALLHKGSKSDIDTVIVKGKVIVKEKKFLGLDEEEIRERYGFYARKSWQDAGDEQQVVAEMMPYVIQFFDHEAFPLPKNYQFNTK